MVRISSVAYDRNSSKIKVTDLDVAFGEPKLTMYANYKEVYIHLHN